MIRIYRFTIAGMLGAIIAWAVLEPIYPYTPPGQSVRLTYGQNFVIGLVSGLCIGLLLGIADALTGLSRRDAGKRILLGAAFGAAGGILGISFGNVIYSALAGPDPYGKALPAGVAPEALPQSEQTPGLIKFMLLLVGRGTGWAILGGLMGVAPGVATGSTRKMVNGAIGGIIGGAIGGSVFEIMVWLNLGGAIAFARWSIRLVGYVATGAAIGLFTGFIEELRKRAWVMRLVGRNEGKEYLLYKEVTTFGRSEFCDIPIFGDPDVSEQHTSIAASGERFFIQDLGSFYGTTVNGSKITARQPLRDGDTFEVGKTRFSFHDKATARFTSSAPHYAGGAGIPTSQHVCPFCGSVKDAAGNCQCSVGAQPAGSSTVQQPAMQQQTVQQPVQQPTQDLTARPQPGPFDSGGPKPMQGASLTGMSGPYAGQTYVLKPDRTEIGREATKDIGMPMDNTVSRNHAYVAQEGAIWVIHDDGSTNGTYVNARKITRHELTNGDIVQIGSTRLKFDQ